MTDKNLDKIFKELKNIKPDSSYSENSKYLILSSKSTQPQTNKGGFKIFSYFNKYIVSASLIVIFGLIVIGTASYINNSNKKFIAEADEANSSIQIKLNEVKYYIDKKPVFTTSTITQMQIILDNASNQLKDASNLSQTNMEESLKKIKEAQKTFSQIDSLINNQK